MAVPVRVTGDDMQFQIVAIPSRPSLSDLTIITDDRLLFT